MIIVEDVGGKIENVFSRLGIPTRVVFLEAAGSGPIEVVFPMRREYDLQRAAKAAWPQLVRYVGDERRFLPRTILFHLSYEVFGNIGAPSGGFISTNVTNLDQPSEAKRKVVDEPVLVSLGIPSPGGAWDAAVLTYNVDVVIGAHRIEMTRPIAQQVIEAAVRFNQGSRLLKIGVFRCAWSSSRRVVPQALRFEQAEIPYGV